jgi:hypothetical protein
LPAVIGRIAFAAVGIEGVLMKPFYAFALGAALLAAAPASAQTPPAVEKLNAYVGCLNRLSSRSYESRARYFSWAGKDGPTGRERIGNGVRQDERLVRHSVLHPLALCAGEKACPREGGEGSPAPPRR